MHRGSPKAHETRIAAELRLIERGIDPADCQRVLDSLERAVAHVIVLSDLARRDVNGRREHWEAERRRWRSILDETLACLNRDPTGQCPRPGLTTVDWRNGRELHAQA